MTVLIIGLILFVFIVISFFYILKKRSLEKNLVITHRKSILFEEKSFKKQTLVTDNPIEQNYDIQEKPLPEIFIKRNSDLIWEGTYVPFTLDKLSENLEVDLKSKIKEIPPLPNAAHRLISVISDITVSTKTVTEIVSADPVLAGKLLQLVNSSYYGVSKEVKSVGRAIILLGYNTVKNFVLQNNLARVMPVLNNDILSMDQFWIHSLASSTIAHHIATQTSNMNTDPGSISTIALLHDIGKLALALWKPEDFRKYRNEVIQSKTALPIMTEEKTFGLHHALIGYLLAESWKLPTDLCQVILYHHHPTFVNPEKIPDDLSKSVTIIHFSNILSKLCGLWVDNDSVAGTRDDYYNLINKKPPIENLIEPKLIKEILKIKSFISP